MVKGCRKEKIFRKATWYWNMDYKKWYFSPEVSNNSYQICGDNPAKGYIVICQNCARLEGLEW